MTSVICSFFEVSSNCLKKTELVKWFPTTLVKHLNTLCGSKFKLIKNLFLIHIIFIALSIIYIHFKKVEISRQEKEYKIPGHDKSLKVVFSDG